MAAKVEKSTTSIPSRDVVATIDDILSVTKGMTFYGSVTKTYNNPKDKASGSFCTIPIRYEFKDRETRIQAETILRNTCNVNCATPYHPMLRECIKQTAEFFRGLYNTSYVRVNVDTSKMSLKVLYKLDKDAKWCHHDKLIPIPEEALNITLRRPPSSFKMTGLIPVNDVMEISTPFGPPSPSGAASRISRKDSAGKSPPKNDSY
jgi:hypothetical protein